MTFLFYFILLFPFLFFSFIFLHHPRCRLFFYREESLVPPQPQLNRLVRRHNKKNKKNGSYGKHGYLLHELTLEVVVSEVLNMQANANGNSSVSIAFFSSGPVHQPLQPGSAIILPKPANVEQLQTRFDSNLDRLRGRL